MKSNIFIIEAVVGTEFESFIVRNPNGAIMHAGTASSCVEFLQKSFDLLKNPPKNENQ